MVHAFIAKQGSDWHETLPKRVSDDSQHFIFQRRKKVFGENIGSEISFFANLVWFLRIHDQAELKISFLDNFCSKIDLSRGLYISDSFKSWDPWKKVSPLSRAAIFLAELNPQPQIVNALIDASQIPFGRYPKNFTKVHMSHVTKVRMFKITKSARAKTTAKSGILDAAK